MEISCFKFKITREVIFRLLVIFGISLVLGYWIFIFYFRFFNSVEFLVFGVMVLCVFLFAGSLVRVLASSVVKERGRYMKSIFLYTQVSIRMLRFLIRFAGLVTNKREILFCNKFYFDFDVVLGLYFRFIRSYSKKLFFTALTYYRAVLCNNVVDCSYLLVVIDLCYLSLVRVK